MLKHNLGSSEIEILKCRDERLALFASLESVIFCYTPRTGRSSDISLNINQLFFTKKSICLKQNNNVGFLKPLADILSNA